MRLHRRKPGHIIIDRREVDIILAEEMEAQRNENKALRKALGANKRRIRALEDSLIDRGVPVDVVDALGGLEVDEDA